MKKQMTIPAIAQVMGTVFQAALDTAEELGYTVESYQSLTNGSGFQTEHLILTSASQADIKQFADVHMNKLSEGVSARYAYGQYQVSGNAVEMVMGSSEALLDEYDDSVLSLSITNNPEGF